jgi:O-antigen/teichoic acid export membrane protein
VSNVLGPVWVTSYTTARIVGNLVSRFVGVFSHAFWPEITRLRTSNSEYKLFLIYKLSLCLTLIIGCISLYVLHLYGAQMIGIWLKQSHVVDIHLYTLFAYLLPMIIEVYQYFSASQLL